MAAFQRAQGKGRKILVAIAVLIFGYVASWFIAFPLTAYGVPVIGGWAASYTNSVHRPLTNLLGTENWYVRTLHGYGKLVCERAPECRWAGEDDDET